jgi:hypothetical protein
LKTRRFRSLAATAATFIALCALASCKSAGPTSPDVSDPPGAEPLPGSGKGELSTTSLAFTGSDSDGEVRISNVGTGSLSWRIRSVTADWVSAEPTAGTIAPGEAATVEVEIDRSALPAGSTHSAAIGISAGDRYSVVIIRVVPDGQLTLEPASLGLGGTSPSGVVEIVNHGTTVANWSLTGPAWATLDPSAGRTFPHGRTRVIVTPDRSQLGVGRHTGTLTLTSDRGSASATMTVDVGSPSPPPSPTPPPPSTPAPPPPSASLRVDPSAWGFGTEETETRLRVLNEGGEPLDWTASPSWGWVSLSPASGRVEPNGSATVVVRVSRSGLSPGTHTATVRFLSNGGSATTTLTVGVPEAAVDPARLRLDPDALEFGTGGNDLTFRIFNDGGEPLDWTAEPSWGWISLSAVSGRVPAHSNATVNVRVARSGLPAGSHQGTVLIGSNGGEAGVAVAVEVAGTTPDPARLRLSGTKLDFGAEGIDRTVRIFNDGGQPLDWKARPSLGWIAMTPLEGKVPARSSVDVTVKVTRAGLSAGSHRGTVLFESNGGSASMAIVATVVSPPKLRLGATTLDFGKGADELSLKIFNDGGEPLDWNARGAATWVASSPTSGRVPAGSWQEIMVRVSRAGLSLGDHRSSIDLSSNGGSASASVAMTVVAAPVLRLSASSLDFGETGTSLTLRIFNDGGEPLDWSATSSVAWATLSVSSGRVNAGVSQEITVRVSRSGLASGSHAGSLRFESNGGGSTVSLSLVVPATTPSPPPPPPPDETGTVNVRDFGARGDGLHDDTEAFEAALHALRLSGGTLHVPAGTYIINPYRKGALEITGLSNVTLSGEGLERSILLMAPVAYTGSTHVILVNGSSGIAIRDLTIDGNYPNATYNGQQSHGIEVRNSSDLRFERLRFMRLYGDGIRLVGHYQDSGPWTERVVVANSRFEDTGRSGVGMQRAVQQVQILNNTFERVSDQSISSEPGGRTLGDVAPRDILMEGNVIRHMPRQPWAVSLQGSSPTDVAQRLVFRNNRVENGAVTFRKTDDLRIEGNVIIGGPTSPALELPTNVTNVQVVNNEISGQAGGDGVVQVMAEYDARAYPSHVTLSNNRIHVAGVGQSGIFVRDALSDITIVDNEIYTEAGIHGIHVFNREVRGSLRTGFIIRDNVIQNFQKGIRFGTEGDSFAGVEIAGNSIDHNQESPTETIGIVFAATGPYEAFATLVANIFGGGIKTHILLSK